MRHDNGLVFGSRAYRALVRDYGLTQEYIAPYTPEQRPVRALPSAPSKRNAPGSTALTTSPSATRDGR
ncbi:MAG: hypothetical protein HS117_17470 [Verrucomicrobiaceae bacterium]|nr:hypothetical protein [Verrucomicrobiaceae bacterium]